MNATIAQSPINKLTDPAPLSLREFLSYCFLATIFLFGASMLILSVFIVYPKPNYVLVGNVNDLPAPNSYPYALRYGSERIWIVNTGMEVIAFSGRTPHQTRYPFNFVAPTTRFEDPLTGSKFSIYGEYIFGPAFRNLDRYPIIIEHGQVWVDVSTIIPGNSLCHLSSNKVWCEYIYKFQTMFTGNSS